MMKKYALLILMPFLLGLLPVEVNAQQESFAHDMQYFVRLKEKKSSEKEIQATLKTLNSIEIWNSDESDMRLWAVNGFPFKFNGKEINSLEELAAQIKKNKSTKKFIKEVALDELYEVETDVDRRLARSTKKTSMEEVAKSFLALEQTSLSIDDKDFVGENAVRIAILDSGISTKIFQKAYGSYDDDDDDDDGITLTGYDYVHSDKMPEDENGHGTQVAGIMYSLLSQLGETENVILDIRKTHDANGQGTISMQVAAIIDAVKAGADIINMSFSHYTKAKDGDLDPIQTVIDFAHKHGVLLVAAAGNESLNLNKSKTVPYPAALPGDNVVSVASNDADRQLSAFSNYGTNFVDVSFLGEGIIGYDLSGNEVAISGTSFSTAIVSAMAAVLASHQEVFDPALTKCLLINNTKESSGLKSLVYSGGTIKLYQALKNLSVGCSNNTMALSAQESNWPSPLHQDIILQDTEVKASVRVFPNPAQHSTQLDLGQYAGQAVTIDVYDALAKRMKRIDVDANSAALVNLNLEGLDGGIYTVSVYPRTGGQPFSKRLVVVP